MIKRFTILCLFVFFLPTSCPAITNLEFFLITRAQRQIEVNSIKGAVSAFDLSDQWPSQVNNGDEELYSDLRGSFGKGLVHQASGFLNVDAFDSLVTALQAKTQTSFNNIQVGLGDVLLVNPQASLAYSLTGIDGWRNVIPPAPTFASAETAGEMVEVYWTALVRDVPFNEFSSNVTVASAVADLNTLSDFKGPKIAGMVTPATFLRGNTPGDLVGPYISQFLYQTIPYGSTTISPDQTVPDPGTLNDFNTTFVDWLTVISGGTTGNTITYDATPHFIRTPRDLSEYVHQDFPGQEGINSALILLSYGSDALDPNNPYLNNPTQFSFVTFGVGMVLNLVYEATQEALKAAWYQKWQVNRRLRPEEFGFYVQEQVANNVPLGINNELINSDALVEINNTYSSYFLPVAYPEGSPTHPSYPAGHATFIGALVTVLKAFFNENFEIPLSIQPNATNDALEVYLGPALTVGGELNKLAANISLGRDHAGVHYRSDGACGMQLGEQIAIDVINNKSFLFNENFAGFTLTKFDGTTITVGARRTP